MAKALQVMAQRMRFRAGAHDQHVARAHAAGKAPVEQNAIDQPPQAQSHGDQADRDDHNAARNVVGVHQVKGPGEQQRGGEDRPARSVVARGGSWSGACGSYRCMRRLAAIKASVKPSSSASRMPRDCPWISVPCQKPRAPSSGPVRSS